MLCETCETVELEVLYDDEEFELDVDFQGEIINIGGSIDCPIDIGIIDGKEIYDYDFREGVWYTFCLKRWVGIQSNGKVIAFCYTMVTNPDTPLLLVVDLYSFTGYRFNLKDKVFANLTQDWLAEIIADLELNEDSQRPIANFVVAEAINNIKSKLPGCYSCTTIEEIWQLASEKVVITFDTRGWDIIMPDGNKIPSAPYLAIYNQGYGIVGCFNLYHPNLWYYLEREETLENGEPLVTYSVRTYDKFTLSTRNIIVSEIEDVFLKHMFVGNSDFVTFEVLEDIIDTTTETCLPAGSYLSFKGNQSNLPSTVNEIGCWSRTTNNLYKIERVYRTTDEGTTEVHYKVTSSKDIVDEGDYYTEKTIEGALQEIGTKFKQSNYATKEELNSAVGDIQKTLSLMVGGI